MNKVIFVFTFLFLSAVAASFAEQAQQMITLKDGSQIKGELTGIQNGIYTVKTPIIGDIHVAASDVASITNGGTSAAGTLQNNAGNAAALPPAGPATEGASSSNTALDQQILAQQQKLMSNPQTMAELQQMAQDPEIMHALSDPTLVQAVTSHDYQAVQNNPKVQELMNNPKMHSLLKELGAQQQQQKTSSQ